MALTDTRTARVLFTALLFVAGLALVYLTRHTLILFLFAIFFAYLVEPLVSQTVRWVRTRTRAIAVIYLGLAILLTLFFSFIGPRIGHEAQRLTQNLPALLGNISSGQIAIQIGKERGWSFDTQLQVKAFLASHSEEIGQLASRAGLRLATLAQNIWWLILIPILAVFFLRDGRTFTDVVLMMIGSRPQREFVEGVINDLNDMLAHFIRAQLTLAALALLVYVVFLGIMRVPYALVLGTAGGILEFIPVVGPFVAAVLILGVALLMSYQHLFLLALFLGVWRLVQDYVTLPRIMGETMQLHPLAAIFGVLAGAEIAGVIGVFLSIPVMASLRIVWQRWRIYAEKKKFGPLEGFAAVAPNSGTKL
ncbi:MAG TPA: AI-2E family transporter [Terriglobales bacterium]|nr:AI-2E family transporter [Terriglobales bacterium]